MDILKNNLFYLILVAAVLIVSVPSYILASRRQEHVNKARSDAEALIRGLANSAKRLEPVSEDALELAADYRRGWEEQEAKVFELLQEADAHLDSDFLVPAAEGKTPDPEQYKAAYNAGYDALSNRLVAARLANPGNSPLPKKANLETRLPTPEDIRISQKQYWIVKEFVDILTDPACQVKSVRNIDIDYVPNQLGMNNKPDPTRTFWVYPALLEFQIDFRTFPVLMQKFLENRNVVFFPETYEITRSFDDTKPVYTPTVAVQIYCPVWDYISTPFETSQLEAYGGEGGKAAGKTGGKGRARRR
jgi:hypothetical protein